jgi:diguanylate cyclase (GGDEF)-like protein
LLSLLRIAQWKQRDDARVELAQAQRWLSSVQLLLAVVMGVTSAFAAWTTVSKFFSSVLLVPISLTFGALCLSHAMGSLPRAAVSSVFGIVPPAIALIIFGEGQIKLIGVSALSVVLLQIVFLRSGYAALIELLRLQKRLAELASYDSLTGLLSRRALLHAVQERVTKDAAFTLALVDLDGFKAVNDTHGHAMGDALLRAVSQRFMKCGDAVGRLGGDEFVLLIDGVDEPEASMEKILEAARQPVEADGATLHVSASVGYATFPLDGKDTGTLMRVADEAMYSAKNSGKARAVKPLSRGERSKG